MQIVTIEEAKRDLERLLTQVLDDAAPTIVLLASGPLLDESRQAWAYQAQG